ncbi:MAG TPA: LuxR C-terminal-related transcriptional regulator [Actinophytocola sp.]|nr:LuxR C-terminal-related transcriptional regulator [Actinophytocola sp.]
MCAPAGYGKTLLLADWIERTGAADKAWVSLDGGDNDAGRFWTAVLGAVCACESVPSASRLHDLRPPGVPDAAGFLAEVIDGLAALPAPLYLVLDDVQELLSEQTWHGVSTLVRHQPRNIRLVLSTRADPPLPLARLRVQGELAELRADRLRFSEEDAAELLRRADVALDPEQVRRLVGQTEGWPAGLRLAARSLREVPDREAFLAEFDGDDRAIADFLVSEVLAWLPAETTEVLSRISVCDEVTPALATALSGRADAGLILAGLERDNDLVLGVGPDRQWYRMHPLLRSYLLADLARQYPGDVGDLHETAAVWFAAQEQPAKAFEHVTRTGGKRTLVQLLRAHAVTLLLTGDDDQAVRRALLTVGTDTVADAPALSLISALAHAANGDPGLAEADVAACWAAWPGDPGTDLVRLRRLVRTTQALLRLRPPPAETVEWAEVIAAHEGTDEEAWARLCLGWSLLWAGDTVAARLELDAAERVSRERGLDHLTMLCLSVRGVLCARDGEFTAMAAAATEAIGLACAHGWTTSPWLCANHLMLGGARLVALDPVGVLDEARLATAALREDTDSSVLRYLIGLLTGAAYVDAGRLQEGLPLLQRARHDHADVTVPAALLAAGALIEHRATVDLGHDALAQQLTAWTRERLGAVAELEIMHAWTSFARGALYSTELAVRDVLDGTRAALCPTTRLEARLLETALEIRLSRRTRARGALSAALALAEPAALVRPFHHADSAVRMLLLEQVGGFGRTNGFAARVSQIVSTMDAQPVDVLTSREHAVLIRLSSPQSLDELATDMSVSVNTVKTHVRAIYAKLGVNNRRAAVVAGRQMGLH